MNLIFKELRLKNNVTFIQSLSITFQKSAYIEYSGNHHLPTNLLSVIIYNLHVNENATVPKLIYYFISLNKIIKRVLSTKLRSAHSLTH